MSSVDKNIKRTKAWYQSQIKVTKIHQKFWKKEKAPTKKELSSYTLNELKQIYDKQERQKQIENVVFPNSVIKAVKTIERVQKARKTKQSYKTAKEWALKIIEDPITGERIKPDTSFVLKGENKLNTPRIYTKNTINKLRSSKDNSISLKVALNELYKMTNTSFRERYIKDILKNHGKYEIHQADVIIQEILNQGGLGSIYGELTRLKNEENEVSSRGHMFIKVPDRKSNNELMNVPIFYFIVDSNWRSSYIIFSIESSKFENPFTRETVSTTDMKTASKMIKNKFKNENVRKYVHKVIDRSSIN